MFSWLLVIAREREPVECVPLNERRAHGSDTTLQKPEIPDLVKPNTYLQHHQSSFASKQLKTPTVETQPLTVVCLWLFLFLLQLKEFKFSRLLSCSAPGLPASSHHQLTSHWIFLNLISLCCISHLEMASYLLLNQVWHLAVCWHALLLLSLVQLSRHWIVCLTFG